MNYITDIEELELWKAVTIEGYEHYWVSNGGRVMNSRTGIFLKPSLNHGYHQVVLSSAGDRITRKVHRLVGLAWIPNPDNKKTINHIDGSKTNNHVDNLEWMTLQENLKHAHDTGLHIYQYRDKLLADKEKIEDMLIKGFSYRKIANVYDCSSDTIREFVIDNNLRVSNYAYGIPLTNDQIQEAYELLSKKESLRSIGKTLGVSYSTVRSRLNKLYGKGHIDEIMLAKVN